MTHKTNTSTFAQFCRIADLIAEAGSPTQTTALPLLTAKAICSWVAINTGADFDSIWNAAVEMAFPTPQPERNVSYPGTRYKN